MMNNLAIKNVVLKNKTHQGGFALIASLFILVLMTLIALAMFNGLTLDERMGGNLREKSRALESAQAALKAGQASLQIFAKATLAKSSNPTIAANVTAAGTIVTTCSASTTYSASPLTICLNAVASNFTNGIAYQPTAMTVSATGGIGTYAAKPVYYIQYIGQDQAATSDLKTSGLAPIYLITARGIGGNDSAVAVLQTVYHIEPEVTSGVGS